ncbi:MAG: hypothetical protein IJH58_02245 [Clostridia bacterium]|nr:hypothetical protein [Clostridia bacterium]
MKKTSIAALIAAALAVLVIFGLLVFRMVTTMSSRAPDDVDTKPGLAYLQAQEKADVAKNENALRSQQATTAAAAQTTSAIRDGNFRAAFRDTLICGDSLVKALTEYSILDKTQVIAEVSVGTEHLEKNMGTIVARNPQYLVLHYGENDLDHMDRATYFIKSYKECLETLQKRLPNTKIFVDSIWPVTAKANDREPLTKYILDYNKLMREMCKEVGVTYVDYDPFFASFTENYYDPDGVHPKYKFYTEQYLPFVYTEVRR